MFGHHLLRFYTNRIYFLLHYQISHKVDEILSLKSHIGSISDTLSGKFNEEKPRTATPDQPKDTKPKVILFGTSNTKNIDTSTL
jgi:hypothetical protein